MIPGLGCQWGAGHATQCSGLAGVAPMLRPDHLLGQSLLLRVI